MNGAKICWENTAQAGYWMDYNPTVSMKNGNLLFETKKNSFIYNEEGDLLLKNGTIIHDYCVDFIVGTDSLTAFIPEIIEPNAEPNTIDLAMGRFWQSCCFGVLCVLIFVTHCIMYGRLPHTNKIKLCKKCYKNGTGIKINFKILVLRILEEKSNYASLM